MLPNSDADIFIWPKYDRTLRLDLQRRTELGKKSRGREQIAMPARFKSFSRSVSLWLKGSRSKVVYPGRSPAESMTAFFFLRA